MSDLDIEQLEELAAKFEQETQVFLGFKNEERAELLRRVIAPQITFDRVRLALIATLKELHYIEIDNRKNLEDQSEGDEPGEPQGSEEMDVARVLYKHLVASAHPPPDDMERR